MSRPVTLRLILGDQLDVLHPWFEVVDPAVVYLLMEVRQETDYTRHHAQKVIAVLAAMRDFARAARAAGHRVQYLAIDDANNRQLIPDNLNAAVQAFDAGAIEYQLPDEWRLDEQLKAYAERATVPVTAVDSRHFYEARESARVFFGERPHWLMEALYREMRVRHGVLVDADGRPEGGQWNFDHDNRKAWRGDPPPPHDPRPLHDHSALWRTIQAAGVDTFGDPSAERLRWPLNRGEALQVLDAFVHHALQHFGDYQDAMSGGAPRLFHSLLSFALNTKMLNPREVVARAEAAWREGAVSLPAAEGFIRQILGWREYVRGVYWAHMPGYTGRNALQHERPLPRWFWDGDTHMNCLAHALSESLGNAYAHHIQRLMVIGNFALLGGLSTEAVHQWYLGVYIDAFEWVEAPNTLGLSQFADGGLLATKPYVSGAAYIDRMSDYCKGCGYDRKARTGEGACPFNALYWDFFARHQRRFAGNQRLTMVYRQLDRFPADERRAIHERAETLLARLDDL